jgi:predicted ATPase with chaperone activity
MASTMTRGEGRGHLEGTAMWPNWKTLPAGWTYVLRVALLSVHTTSIHRIAGHTGVRTALVTIRQFRAPHHTISDAGLIGGGHVPMPGDVSRAHHGVLFLDAWPEFRRYVLGVLRQLLKNGITAIQSPRRH